MPENLPSKETEISLREYLERVIADFRHHVDVRFDSAQTAIDKAERAMNERLQGMNEFRDTLRDQAGKFATVQHVDEKVNGVNTAIERTEERIAELEQFKNNMQGRMWAIPSIMGLVVFILTQLMRVLFPAGTP